MLTRDIIKKIRVLEITTNRIVNETMAGAYHSVFKGRGMEFDEVRPYQPGDEIRLVDWNVSARMNGLFVKRFVEERELTVILLVDMSASSDFGTLEQTKADLAAEISSTLAFSAIKNNDRVGLILFTDRVEKYVAPKKGKKHVLRVISDILSFRPAGKGTSINAALRFMGHVLHRKSVVFLLSDFRDAGFEPAMAIAARKHDLIPVVVSDRFENDLRDLGVALVEDPETGERRYVDLSNWGLRKAYTASVAAAAAERERFFKTNGIDHIGIMTGEDYIPPLVRFFRKRRARR
ncbi:MAG: DUF58 domain-containing protein [Deltaproteobacteria bacterium]|nr:DUF58 domain-containing protein [Deltaproteobacteria bacterium]